MHKRHLASRWSYTHMHPDKNEDSIPMYKCRQKGTVSNGCISKGQQLTTLLRDPSLLSTLSIIIKKKKKPYKSPSPIHAKEQYFNFQHVQKRHEMLINFPHFWEIPITSKRFPATHQHS